MLAAVPDSCTTSLLRQISSQPGEVHEKATTA